jgi:hypothetical protein
MNTDTEEDPLLFFLWFGLPFPHLCVSVSICG